MDNEAKLVQNAIQVIKDERPKDPTSNEEGLIFHGEFGENQAMLKDVSFNDTDLNGVTNTQEGARDHVLLAMSGWSGDKKGQQYVVMIRDFNPNRKQDLKADQIFRNYIGTTKNGGSGYFSDETGAQIRGEKVTDKQGQPDFSYVCRPVEEVVDAAKRLNANNPIDASKMGADLCAAVLIQSKRLKEVEAKRVADAASKTTERTDMW